MRPASIAALPFRPCVGVMLANAEGKVFVGQRIDRDRDAWQMPQGGIDPGEDVTTAALRELGEETGVTPDKVIMVAQTEEPLHYDLPSDVVPHIWGGRYRGQAQTWVLMRFTGQDSDIDIATDHPQMMQLFAKLLGKRFLIDHVLTLNRIPGSRGRRWHAHPYRNKGQREVEDPIGSSQSLTTDFFPHQCVRTLCYPEGMGAADGGGELSVMPGAHLYRIPYLWDGARTEYNEQIQAGWMADKIHAFTGEPLKIKPLSLPPGSMVSFVHHMPHHVGHRAQDAPTRWGLLMAYRTPDPDEQPTRWNEGAPAHWVKRMAETGQLTESMRRVFEGDNPS